MPINVKFESSTPPTYAIDFGTQCSLVGNQSSAIVVCPSISSSNTKDGENYTATFTSPSLQLQQQQTASNTKMIGYGAIANHGTIAYTNEATSSLTLVSIDPLSTVSSFHHSQEEIEALGCHAFRTLQINKVAPPPWAPLPQIGSMKLLHFAPIGGVSGIIVAVRELPTKNTSSNDDDANATRGDQIYVGCIKNIPALLGEICTSQTNNVIEQLPAAHKIEWYVKGLSVADVPPSAFTFPHHLRQSKHSITIPLSSSIANAPFLKIDQNNLMETISEIALRTSVSDSISEVPLSISPSVVIVQDSHRPVSDDCCFCMMELFPTEETIAEPESIIPAVSVLSCGHGYHRQCLQMDLSRVDDFVKDGRYFRFRRLGCSMCSSSMRDALRFSVLEGMFAMRKKIEQIAKELDAKIGGSGGDDEPLDERLKRHLFYSCNKCAQPFYGGPYDCGATLADPKTNPEHLICDNCCGDYSCPTHGRSNIVYKCQNCWNIAIPNKRFLGRLRLCVSCFETQKGKPAPSDDILPSASSAESGEKFAAPAGTPFAVLGKDGWAVCGHDAEGKGLSVAGCSSCNSKIPTFESVVLEAVGKEKSPDAAQE